MIVLLVRAVCGSFGIALGLCIASRSFVTVCLPAALPPQSRTVCCTTPNACRGLSGSRGERKVPRVFGGSRPP